MTTTVTRARAPRIDSDPADDWRSHRRCSDEDDDLFFPLGGEGTRTRSGESLLQEQRAKAICARCPVRSECLADALRVDDQWGIWGGLNEAERRALRGPKQLSDAQRAANERSAQVRSARAAARTHCDSGHELTPENTFMNGNHRACRTCQAARSHAYRQRQAVSS